MLGRCVPRERWDVRWDMDINVPLSTSSTGPGGRTRESSAVGYASTGDVSISMVVVVVPSMLVAAGVLTRVGLREVVVTAVPDVGRGVMKCRRIRIGRRVVVCCCHASCQTSIRFCRRNNELGGSKREGALLLIHTRSTRQG